MEKTVHRKYHHGNLKRVLIESAVQLISKLGTKDVTLREIAKRAGVSHAAPYRHFKDKNALLAAVAEQGFDMMLKQTRSNINRVQGDDLEIFAACGHSYLDFALGFPDYYRVMFATRSKNPYFSDGFDPMSLPVFKLFEDILKTCQKKGHIKKGNAKVLAMAAWSTVHGCSMLYIDHHLPVHNMNKEQIEDFKESIVWTVYAGLRHEKDINGFDRPAIKTRKINS